MAKIVPFRALRYNLSQIGDATAVMAPPYDVISPALQQELYQRRCRQNRLFLSQAAVGVGDQFT